jgi:phosphate starvation-inducible protein PhoH and related proteins
MSKRKKSENNNNKQNSSKGLSLQKISPITNNQITTFKKYYDNKHLFLHGFPGTGKTFIAMYLALEEILEEGYYKDLKIIRSTVPSRDIGHLPGSISEKIKIFEEPYIDICSELFDRGDAYSILKQKLQVDFTTTSFLRGNTFRDSIILVDECQNMTFPELNTIITRVGDNSKIIFCGDYRQTDLNKKHELSGISYFSEIIKTMDGFEFIEFLAEDIVRSGLVKEYIIAKANIDEGDRNIHTS